MDQSILIEEACLTEIQKGILEYLENQKISCNKELLTKYIIQLLLNSNIMQDVVHKVTPFFASIADATSFCTWLWDLIFSVSSEEFYKRNTQVEQDRSKWKEMFGSETIHYEKIVQHLHSDQTEKEHQSMLKKNLLSTSKHSTTPQTTTKSNTTPTTANINNFTKPLSLLAKFSVRKDGALNLKTAVKYGVVLFQPAIALEPNDPMITIKGNGEREIDCTKQSIAPPPSPLQQQSQHLQQMKANLLSSKSSSSSVESTPHHTSTSQSKEHHYSRQSMDTSSSSRHDYSYRSRYNRTSSPPHYQSSYNKASSPPRNSKYHDSRRDSSVYRKEHDRRSPSRHENNYYKSSRNEHSYSTQPKQSEEKSKHDLNSLVIDDVSNNSPKDYLVDDVQDL